MAKKRRSNLISMNRVVVELVEILSRRFPGSSPELEWFPGTLKVGGFLVWDGFEAVSSLRRQQDLTRVLLEELGAAYPTNVTVILTVTHLEAAVIHEG